MLVVDISYLLDSLTQKTMSLENQVVMQNIDFIPAPSFNS